MLEVLKFIFETPLHYFGTLLILALIGYSVANFRPISITRNTYQLPSNVVLEDEEETEDE